MQTLERNYRRMEEVVGIIDDIAERTEVLAMNAALEAAGRQEDGGRFGVVASEVQRLSVRISEQTVGIGRLFRELRRASMEMSQAIEASRNRASQGPRWIEKLVASLKDIDRRAALAGRSMNEIAAMTEKQSQALEQMKFMVSEIQSVARVIEEASEKAGASVTTLHSHALRLQTLVQTGEGEEQEQE
jgi:methyl-accepting chemotaxis protein